MSITIRRTGTEIQVLSWAETLPEGEVIELFTPSELTTLQQEGMQWLQLQMPSFLRHDEDLDAEDLLEL